MGVSLGTLSGHITGTTADNHPSLAVAADVYSGPHFNCGCLLDNVDALLLKKHIIILSIAAAPPLPPKKCPFF